MIWLQRSPFSVCPDRATPNALTSACSPGQATRSPAGSGCAVLTDLIPDTFLFLWQPKCHKTSPGSNPERTETPEVGMVMVPIIQRPHHTIFRGSSPNPSHFHRGRRGIQVPTKHYLCCSPGKPGMLKPHYSPSCVPQGPAGIFSPPDCLSANLLPFGKVGTRILKALPGLELEEAIN